MDEVSEDRFNGDVAPLRDDGLDSVDRQLFSLRLHSTLFCFIVLIYFSFIYIFSKAALTDFPRHHRPLSSSAAQWPSGCLFLSCVTIETNSI